MVYDRKIKYLDYLENGDKVRNAGFVKIEAAGDYCNIQINVTGLYPTDTFTREVRIGNDSIETSLGNVDLISGKGSLVLKKIPINSLGEENITYEELGHIRLNVAKNREIMCRWNEKPAEAQHPAPKVLAASNGSTSFERDDLQTIYEKDAEYRKQKHRETEYREIRCEKTQNNKLQCDESMYQEVIDETQENRSSTQEQSQNALGAGLNENRQGTIERERLDKMDRKLWETDEITQESGIEWGEEREEREEKERTERERTERERADEGVMERERPQSERSERESEESLRIENEGMESEFFQQKNWGANEGLNDGRTIILNSGSRQNNAHFLDEELQKGFLEAPGGKPVQEKIQSLDSDITQQEAREKEGQEKQSPRQMQRNGEGQENGSIGGRADDKDVYIKWMEPGQAKTGDGKRRKTENMKGKEKPGTLFDDKWKQLSHIYPHISPFQDDRDYLSIGPSDFVILQKSFHKLVNNSFLLHGFYNYEHLILARVVKKGEERFYVGVPGNFYEREKQVAIMFGFESFECKTEPAQAGNFGYYMIRVEL